MNRYKFSGLKQHKCFFFYKFWSPNICFAQSPSPQNWENKTSAEMQKHEGVLFLAQAGTTPPSPPQHSGVEQEPGTQIYSSIYKFRTKTGSWQGLIGCRGFLVFTDWPVIIPLIGQSYHLQKPGKHDSGIIFGLVHLSKPVMALMKL